MMIIASLMTRMSFFGSLSSSFGTVSIANIREMIGTSEPPSSPSAFATAAEAELPSLTTHSSALLMSQEQEVMVALGARIVRDEVTKHLRDDPTLAGPLLRLAFHDAATREADGADGDINDLFTGGPNGSIQYELEWSENRGLSRPLQVVQQMYGKVESYISLADTIALAGAAAVEGAGGPKISVKLGRVDAAEADPRKRRRTLQMDTDRSLVDTTLPSAALDSDGLRLYFGALGLTEEEFVALCGAHDLGRHVTLLDMPKSCLKDLTRDCLEKAPVLMPFVSEEPDRISNTYFRKLLKWYDRKVELGEVAFIPTDVAMVVDAGLRKYVQKFAKSESAFESAFASAYQKLVDSNTITKERY